MAGGRPLYSLCTGNTLHCRVQDWERGAQGAGRAPACGRCGGAHTLT